MFVQTILIIILVNIINSKVTASFVWFILQRENNEQSNNCDITKYTILDSAGVLGLEDQTLILQTQKVVVLDKRDD